MNNHHISRNKLRKARTRTLIQLGGLIEKSGLFEALGILPGADMQKDENMKPLALMLFGGLLELKKEIQRDGDLGKIWVLKAKEWFR